MEQRLKEVLEGKGGNYMAPFFWQHGEEKEALVTEIHKIWESGIGALCVESRPHEDFGGPGWWRDMDIILSECRKLGMKVWLLDDKHFPTGYANGLMAKKDRRLRRWELTERHMDVRGPIQEGAAIAEGWFSGPEDRLIRVLACERTGRGEELTGKVMDCTGQVKDGLVYLNLPEGLYRILFLYQVRSTMNEVRGLYCDPLSSESMDVLVEAVYEPHWQHYKEYFGNTFVGFFSDEPRFNNKNGEYVTLGTRFGSYPYREEILPLLEEEYGEEVFPLLPALWYPMADQARQAKARVGYMNVITRLYQKNFSEKLGDWSRAHGVEYIGHIIEDNNAHTKTGYSAGHFFRSMEGQDMAGIDVVLHQIVPGMTDYETAGCVGYEQMDPVFFHYALAKLGASHAHLDPKKKGRAMCEMFGAYGWAEGTKMMKWLTDHMIVRGINFFVPHAFSPTFPDPDCPPHFYGGGHNPQYRAFGDLMGYANRLCHLFSGGKHVSSCGILYQAEGEWSGLSYMKMQDPAKVLFDSHLDYEFVPLDYLARARVKKGKVKIGNAWMPALVIPGAQCLPAWLVKKLWELSCQNVPVLYVGCFPETTPEGVDPKSWCQVTETMKLVELSDLPRVLAEFTGRDVEVFPENRMLRVYHSRSEEGDFYLFVNEDIHRTAKAKVRLAGFEKGEYGLYDALLNRLEKRKSGDGTVEITLPPYQSAVVIVGGDLSLGEKEEEGRLKGEMTLDGPYEVYVAQEEALPSYTPYKTLSQLCNLSAAGELPRFSGHFLYKKTFQMPELEKRTDYILDLGFVGETGEVKINGQQAGRRIVPPYRFDVTEYLKEGENLLEIDVANHLGYEQRDMFSRYLVMEPSGLLGPVRLLKVERMGKEAESDL